MVEFAALSALAHRRTGNEPARHAVGGLTISERDDPGDEALAFIEVAGSAALDLLGIGPIALDDEGAATTRLAGLRATIWWRKAPQPWARIAVDRFSADYLWEWLCDRAAVP